ncbi:MAG: aspartate aminotransferase family protein [Spongiibacteraceae bacterium]
MPLPPADHPATTSMDSWWMPFTANRQFKATPRLLTTASGMYYRDHAGAPVLDGTAGLWCVNAGHARCQIIDAVQQQLTRLDYAPPFQMGHSLAFALAERLAAMAPPGLDRIFFTNSGSEAVDTALKIARAYHQLRGEHQRTLLIGRDKGYHGVGFGGISVGGIPNNRDHFGPLLADVDHLPHTLDLERNAFSRGLPTHGIELADALETLIEKHGAARIAAVIVEPISGSAGVILPPQGYLQRLREICTRHGILLIFDEVITGFGRIGATFAAQRFAVTPDLMTTAKGLTNGNIPMGAVFVDRAVHDSFIHAPATRSPGNGIELFHGYTYSAHPVACAAAMATLDIYETENLFGRGRELENYWEQAIHRLRDIDGVVDIRTFGLLAGIELSPQPGSPGTRGYEVFVECLQRGVLVRVTGDVIALSPPLIIEPAQIDQLVETLLAVIAR